MCGQPSLQRGKRSASKTFLAGLAASVDPPSEAVAPPRQIVRVGRDHVRVFGAPSSARTLTASHRASTTAQRARTGRRVRTAMPVKVLVVTGPFSFTTMI
jgi:hypothetical protein